MASEWSCEELAQQIKKLGFGQYSRAFLKNEINGSHLPLITEAHLEELGVNVIGHRILLLHRFAEIISGKQIYSTPNSSGYSTPASSAEQPIRSHRSTPIEDDEIPPQRPPSRSKPSIQDRPVSRGRQQAPPPADEDDDYYAVPPPSRGVIMGMQRDDNDSDPEERPIRPARSSQPPSQKQTPISRKRQSSKPQNAFEDAEDDDYYQEPPSSTANAPISRARKTPPPVDNDSDELLPPSRVSRQKRTPPVNDDVDEIPIRGRQRKTPPPVNDDDDDDNEEVAFARGRSSIKREPVEMTRPAKRVPSKKSSTRVTAAANDDVSSTSSGHSEHRHRHRHSRDPLASTDISKKSKRQPSPPSDDDNDDDESDEGGLVKCPCCNRSYAPQAAKLHIPVCQRMNNRKVPNRH